MTNKRSAILTALFLVALLLSLFVMKKFAAFFSKTPTSPDKIIMAYADDITYTSYDKNGLLQSNIKATSMENYKTRSKSFFKYPHGLVYTTKRIPWYFRANEGVTRNKNEWIDLTGNVFMHQLPVPYHPETIIKTEKMSINPKKELATSDQYVQVQQLGNKFEGVGMKADMNKGIIDILSRSKGYYVPKKSNSQ